MTPVLWLLIFSEKSGILCVDVSWIILFVMECLKAKLYRSMERSDEDLSQIQGSTCIESSAFWYIWNSWISCDNLSCSPVTPQTNCHRTQWNRGLENNCSNSKSLFLFTFHDHFRESSLVIEVESLTSNVEDKCHGIKWDDITDTMFHIWEGINAQITFGIPFETPTTDGMNPKKSRRFGFFKKGDSRHQFVSWIVRRFIGHVSPFLLSGGFYAVSWRGGFWSEMYIVEQ